MLLIDIHIVSSVSARKLKCPSSARNLFSLARLSSGNISSNSSLFIFNITGPVVELEVAKQGAIFHGLQELLARPSPLLSPRGRPGSTQPQQWIQGQPPQEQHLYQNHRPGMNQSYLSLNKIVMPKLLPKNELTNLFFYPEK